MVFSIWKCARHSLPRRILRTIPWLDGCGGTSRGPQPCRGRFGPPGRMTRRTASPHLSGRRSCTGFMLAVKSQLTAVAGLLSSTRLAAASFALLWMLLSDGSRNAELHSGCETATAPAARRGGGPCSLLKTIWCRGDATAPPTPAFSRAWAECGRAIPHHPHAQNDTARARGGAAAAAAAGPQHYPALIPAAATITKRPVSLSATGTGTLLPITKYHLLLVLCTLVLPWRWFIHSSGTRPFSSVDDYRY